MPNTVCNDCGLDCGDLSNLKKHLTSIYGCDKQNSKTFMCECGKRFTTQRALDHHIKTSCNNSKETFILNKQLQDKQQELEEAKNKINEANNKIKELINSTKRKPGRPKKVITNNNQKIDAITNIPITVGNGNISGNNSTNTITNNVQKNEINLINFGQEDISLLSDDDMHDILNSCYQAIVRCTKYVHCNDKLPEQRNVFITNDRSNKGFIFKDNKYIMVSMDELLDTIVKERTSDIKELLNMEEIKISEKNLTKLNDLIDTIDEYDKKQIEITKSDIKMLIYNENRHLKKRG